MEPTWPEEVDPGLALEILREFRIERLLREGGANGTFLGAGLVDEIRLVTLSAVDGAKGALSVTDSSTKMSACQSQSTP